MQLKQQLQERSGLFKMPVLMLLALLFSYNFSYAQFNLHISISSIPSTHSADSIFIAGSFNRWDPGNESYRLTRSGDQYSINITGLASGDYFFKFTRGIWDKCESAINGKHIENRKLSLVSDTAIEMSIDAWKDDFPAEGVKSTAGNSVHVMDTAFFIPQLNRSRKIWIYLPPGYENSKKKYPVLYMQDGQNLFDDSTSFNGEWGIDECLDSLYLDGSNAGIVVGIENSPERLTEYAPFETENIQKPEGEAYADFLAHTLKPYIDKKYRTLPGKENTIIAGSSLGANISYYTMLRYPHVFGKGGIFSPALWIMPGLMKMTDSLAYKINGQFFIYAGGQESETMFINSLKLADMLGEQSVGLIYFVNDPAGKHHEQAWRKWFAEFYLWITGNGLNYQVKHRH